MALLKILSKPRNWIILLILLLFAAVTVQTIRANRFEKQKIEAEKQTDEAVNLANGEQEKTNFYVNQFQEQVAKTKQTEIGADIAMRVKELAWINEFEGLDKKYKNLISASSIDMSISVDKIPLKPLSLDSLLSLLPDSIRNRKKIFEFKLKDEYNDIYALVLDSPRLDIKVPLKFVDESLRKHKFIFKNWRYGKNEYFRETKTGNKLVKIEAQQIYTIRKKRL